jgi:hypothetical protein
MTTFNEDWKFQLDYYPSIRTIIEDNAKSFISVSVADAEADMNRATDFIVRVEGGDISVRIRRSNIKFRDITIRSYKNGNKTEIHKLKEGLSKFYLYCWTNDKNEIYEWILADLDKMRELNVFDNKKEISNKDGITRFIALPIKELEELGCVISKNK